MPAITRLLALALLATAACAVDEDPTADEGVDVMQEGGGKEDGATLRYRLKRADADYRPLNEAQDEWAHGILDAAPLAGGQYEVTSPWYKVTPDLSTGLWWRMDIRQAAGEDRVQGIADKGVAFFVLWRGAESDSAWTLLKPEVTTAAGRTNAVGLYSSFKVDNGALEVTSPLFAGTAGSDFFWNDVEPELAFVPVPYDVSSKLPGVGQFEIAITEIE